MKSPKKRLTMAVTLMMLTGSLLAVTPGTALAASPRCWDNRQIHAPTSGDGNRKAIELPVDDRDTPDWRCRLWKGMGWNSGTGQLQRTLNRCYYSRINIIGTQLVEDGNFGSLTKAALIKVQQYHGITADGIYGPQTASTIIHEARSDSSAWSAYCGLTVRQAGLL